MNVVSWKKELIHFGAIFTFITGFAIVYWFVYTNPLDFELHNSAIDGEKDDNFLDYFFYSAMIQSTLGFAQVYPRSIRAKLATLAQVVSTMIVFVHYQKGT